MYISDGLYDFCTCNTTRPGKVLTLIIVNETYIYIGRKESLMV